MAKYKILYWHEYPTQFKVVDGSQKMQVKLSDRFQDLIDREAMKRGLVGTDAYLDGWQWSGEQEREGSVEQVAEAVRQELEASFPD